MNTRKKQDQNHSRLSSIILELDSLLFSYEGISYELLTEEQSGDIVASKELLTSGRDMLINILKDL